MGYMRHHAIIVTGWDVQTVNDAQAKARQVFPQVSQILPGEVNTYYSFFIPPDGSKEGWPEDEKGNKRREDFIGYLKTIHYLDWVELQYGDEEGWTAIIRHSNEIQTEIASKPLQADKREGG